MTIDELTELYTMEVLVEAASALGVGLQERYDADSAELSALMEKADELRTSTTSNTSKSTKSKAPGRKTGSGSTGSAPRRSGGKLTTDQLRQQQQQKSQGAMVAAQQQMTRSALAAARRQGKTDSQAYVHNYAQTFLSDTANGLTEFAGMIGGINAPLTQISDAVILEDELEALKGEMYDKFLFSSEETAETLHAEFAAQFEDLGAELAVENIQAWIDEENWEADREGNVRPLSGTIAGFQLLLPA